MNIGNILHSAVPIMTPLLLAASGGLFCELAGKLNIGLEGLLLIGAFFGIITADLTGSLIAGLAAAAASAMLISLLMAWIVIRLKANLFITGMAINMLASGLTTVLAFRWFGNKGVISFPDVPALTPITIPGIERIPLLGPLLSGHNQYTLFSLLVVLFIEILLKKTTFGMHLRCCGINAKALRSVGISPTRYQYAAFILCGCLCGIAGASLSQNIQAWVPNISSGRGWIALVIIFLGFRKPGGILAATFLFGLSEAVSNALQGILNIPADYILSIPYLIALAAIILFSIISKKRDF